MSQIRPIVEAVREAFWGAPDAPFETSPEGLEAALAWIRQAKKEDEAALEGKRPGLVTFSITLEDNDLGKTMDALDLFESDPSEGEPLPRPILESVTAVLTHIEAEIASQASRLQSLNLSADSRTLDLVDATGWTHPIPIFRGTRLASLSDHVSDVCRHSGWWSEAEALAFIMCGLIPPAAVRITMTHKGDGRKEITMKVVAPTTAKAITDVYQRTLVRYRLTPKTLSKTQHAALELFYDTPSLSWPNRYKRWLKLYAERPGIAHLNGPDSLRITCTRALKRASWIGEEN